ncbi:DUF2306 domain-containing protein [Labrenzia sp. PHM005]|uniref:DUF2306 domain-containing protein n=1 Tax=Labrenzia sp. PHM005 TaxID=2590016 RepID=UPI001AD90245|nr:DUF2306 domain-containing protein [Labrenzia sp. PHM005]
MLVANRAIGQTGYWIAAVFSVLVALASFRFLVWGVPATMEIVAHNLDGNRLALYGHIGFAPVALAVMPFQFLKGLRARKPHIHRWLGRIYVAAIAISGISGLILAFTTIAGTFAGFGFGILAVIWLGTTGAALVFALKRDFARHRVWMIRSAALTFAAVTLRLQLPIGFASGAEFSSFYPIVAWSSWVPNAILAEIYLFWMRQGRQRPSAEAQVRA